MKVSVSARFARQAKKLKPREKELLDHAVRAIVANPKSGESKVGDLAGIRVYKYKDKSQLYLVGYQELSRTEIFLIEYGTHENFYRDLKRKI